MTLKKYFFILLFAPLFCWADSLVPVVFQTSHKLPVYFVQRKHIPMLDVAVVFAAGSARDGDHLGLANLTQDLMGHETQNHTEEALLTAIAKTGAELTSELTRDMSIWKLRTLTDGDKLKESVALFHSVLTKPSFSEKITNRVKDQLRVERLEKSQHAVFIANNAFFRSLYNDHPYAHSSLGTEESLKNITSADCLSFYQKHYTNANAFMVIIGDVTLSKAKRLANQISDGLLLGEKLPPIPPATAGTHKNIYLAQDKAQTTILIGQLGFPAYSEQHYAQLIGNYILGGSGLSSLLAKQVRTKRGLAYHVSSRLGRGEAIGPFLMLSQSRTKNAKKTYQTMLKTYRHFLGRKVTQAQLEEAKSGLIYRSQLESVSNEQVLSDLISLAFYHFPVDYMQTFSDKIKKVTQQQIKDSFAVLKSRPLISVAVGKENVFT